MKCAHANGGRSAGEKRREESATPVVFVAAVIDALLTCARNVPSSRNASGKRPKQLTV